jgi:hypothetical protein
MMKARHSLLCAALFFFFNVESILACGYNYYSSCATQLNIAVNGVNTTYAVGNCTFLTDFQNTNFGTINELSLSKLTQLNWESCTNNVFNTRFYYRIYNAAATPGNFISMNLPQTAFSVTGDYRNRTFEASPNLDLLLGVPTGVIYTLEVYFASDVDFNQDNIADGSLIRNNAGAFYKATFKKGGTVGGLTVSIPTKTNVSCAGGNDGTLSATASGGTAPYTYAWSTGAAGTSIINLSAAAYTVTVTSTNGLTGTAISTISQPQPINAFLNVIDETSASVNNGSINVIPSGGTAPFTYLWSTGGTTATISNLDAGTYTVTIKDAKNCQLVKTATVNTSGTTTGNYCVVAGIFPWNDWIGQVTLDGLNNISDKTGYASYTNLAAANLVAGQSYPISIKTGSGWFPNAVTWRVYIDYNRNGVFDLNEVALDAQSNPPVSGLTQLVVNQNITIPPSALDGITRMRVIIKRGLVAPLPCDNVDYGEIEDYNVKITGGGGTGGGCPLVASANTIVCNNNGTPAIPTDDTFTFALNVAGTGTGWTSVINGVTVTGSYGTVKNLGPYAISSGALNIMVSDNVDATCKKPLTVTPPSTCSAGGNLTYCVSRSDFPWEEWISKVTFAGINNVTGKWYSTDYTTQIGAVIRGQTYPITVSSSFSWQTNTPYVKVWIDYNQDGTFQEPAEVAYLGSLTGVANGTQNAPFSGNVIIPASATPGITRMRVSLRRNAYATPCDVIPNGEVEDYSINIATTLNLVADVSNRFDISAEIEQGYTDIRTVFNMESPMRYLLLERAGEDMQWKGVTLWDNIYLPEDELIVIKTKDEAPLDGINHYRFMAVLENGEKLNTDIKTVEYKKPLDFSIFPNPVSGEVLNVNLERLVGQEVEMMVLHPTGVAVLNEKIDNLSENIVPINVSQLATGEYFLLIRSAKMRPLTKKFVVVHE